MSAGEMVLLSCWAVVAIVFSTILAVRLQSQTPRVTIGLEHVDKETALVCHVPRATSNRWLDMGLSGIYSHGLQLNGDSTDPTTVRIVPPPFGCDPADVLLGYCRLLYVEGGKTKEAGATINVPCRE